jgi:hypothetical protein
MLNCNSVRPRVDELLHGELSPGEIAACERHIGDCADCAAALADAEALQTALLSMPVPELRPGFAAEALAVARRQHIGPADAVPAETEKVLELPRRRRLRPDSWWGALGGALAAGILLAALWDLPSGTPVEKETPASPVEFRLALYEPRDITIAIDTEQALPGARLTVRVDGGIELVGFGDTRELSWEADLEEGTNTLSLPVLAHSLEQGRLTTLVEHGQRRQQIELAIRTDAPGGEEP